MNRSVKESERARLEIDFMSRIICCDDVIIENEQKWTRRNPLKRVKKLINFTKTQCRFGRQPLKPKYYD